MMMAGPYHQPTTLEEVRTLWIGDLQYWADENYLYGCFAHTGEVGLHPTSYVGTSLGLGARARLWLC